MSARGCGLGRSAREMRRRHYCGTCKVIGREYGQASRLFLNHDTVLLAEIVTALTEAPEWGAAIESRNCFQLPKKAEATPAVLRYAAAATVLLASAKVQDHASDSGKLKWRVLTRWLNPHYRRAAAALCDWGVPVRDIERKLATQQQRESRPESLEQLAEPTCFATAEICRHAAKLAPTEMGAKLGMTLERFGRRFGYLIYLLDAWEDFERDAACGDFNAFRALYGKRGLARPYVLAAADAVSCSFQELPVGEVFRSQLLVRFQSNFTARFAVTLPIMMAPITPGIPPLGAPRKAGRGSWCGACDGDGCCDGCGDSCWDGCSSCDCS